MSGYAAVGAAPVAAGEGPGNRPAATTRHGVQGYVKGCRCDVCIELGRAYYRAYHGCKNPRGATVRVDSERLRRAIHATDTSITDFSVAAGFNWTTVAAIIRKGRCSEYTLDTIACALGCHMSEFEEAS